MTPFSNLHVHDEYSLLDGFGTPEAFARRAAELGQPALAQTNHGNLIGAVEHVHACKKVGIKPILGCELYVAPGSRYDRNNKHRYDHLTVLAMNHAGWVNLLQIAADASLEGYYYRPRTDHSMLAAHSDGLIVLSGCLGGELAGHLKRSDLAGARSVARWFREVFGDRYYLEVQDHGQDEDALVNPQIAILSAELGIRTVATSDCHYPTRDDAGHADVLHCLQTGATLNQEKRFRLTPFGTYYLPSGDELARTLGEAAVAESVRIADRIDADVLDFGRVDFPALPWLVADGETPEQALRRILNERWKTRYPGGMTAEVIDRVKYELQVIEKMGFSPYFLIVYDYVNWARERGIVCQPRGSAGGSMVLYILGISDLDPLRWDLPFERFLNPDRVSMPDIDMDFPDARRHEVLGYLVQRYGRDRVGQIVAISRLKARAAIRDVGRAMGHDREMTDELAALVPVHPVDTTLAQALQRVPELQARCDADPLANGLVTYAQKLEKTVRHASTHAAGAVVSAVPLNTVVPLQRPTKAGDADGLAVCQWDMHWLEESGLIKFDLLGLSNLSMVERALALVREHRGTDLDLWKIPLDDAATWELLRAGRTKTVFQLESHGMTGWLKKLEPDRVEHLAAMVALYRPGPLHNIPAYIERRHGREHVTYPHQSLAQILKGTYGIPVFQEQVMAISRTFAGFTPGEADTLRKVMGKKQKEKIEEQKAKFIAGSVNQGHSESEAAKLFEWIEPFAGYGFNRSHAVAYGMLAYQTAYLKANYPAEWMAAVLESEAHDLKKTTANLSECRMMRVQVLGPDVNRSGNETCLEGDAIRLGLSAIKNLGATARAILSEREAHGPYADLDDLATRLDPSHVKKGGFEALAKAGALESLGAKRSQVLGGLPLALPAWRIAAKAKGGPRLHVVLPEAPGVKRTVAIDWEREVLGYSVLGHPFERAASDMVVSHRAAEITAEEDGWSISTGGMIAEVQKITTRKGDPMARVVLEDLTGRVQVVVFPSLFAENPALWEEGRIVTVNGRVADDEGEVIVKARSAAPWVAATAA